MLAKLPRRDRDDKSYTADLVDTDTHMVGEIPGSGEYHVRSYLQLARNRFEWTDYQWVTAERNDILRPVDDRFLIARREIQVDTSVLGTPNLAIFL